MQQNNFDRNEKIVPTLDSVGWVANNGREKLDRILANFFTSDGSQSTLYYRQFLTYQVLTQENVGDVERLASAIKTYLTGVIGEYFPECSVEVIPVTLNNEEKAFNELTESAVGLRLTVEVLDNTDYLRMDKPIVYDGGVFKYVLDKFSSR